MMFHLGRKLEPGEQVLHQCDNPACVNPRHLFLGNPLANMRDMVNKGRNRPSRGEANGKSRFAEADIRKMRELYNGGWTVTEIARLFKTKHPVISMIVHKKRWKHVN